MTQTNVYNGAELLIAALKKNNVKNIYGLVGIPVTDWARMAQEKGLDYYGFRREDSAVNAAEAAGYLNGEPGVALTVSAPGFLNGLVALAEATKNCFPMIMLSGSSERPIIDLDRGDYEGLDQYNVAKPLVKAAYRIDRPEDVALGIARAVRTAVSGRPGGVYVDIPGQMLGETLESDLPIEDLVYAPVDPSPSVVPSGESIDRAVELLKSAKHPLAIIGKGAAYAQAENEVKDFIETNKIPFLPMSMAKGVLPDTHESSAAAARSLSLGGADVVLLLGARLNWLLSNGGKPFSPDAQFIQIDIDGTEMDSNRPIQAPIVGDLKSALTKLNLAVKAAAIQAPADWLTAINDKKAANAEKMAKAMSTADTKYPMGFYGVLKPIKDLIAANPDTYLVSEGDNTLDIGRNVIDILQPRHRLDTGTWGVMGIGMGYAAGVAVETGKPVIALEGDSAFGFDAMDIETICRYNLPVIVVVINNGGIYKGTSHSTAVEVDRPDPTKLDIDAHYDMLATAFGGDGYFVEKPDEFQVALQKAYAAGKPAIINVKIDPNMGAESGHIGNLNPDIRDKSNN